MHMYWYNSHFTRLKTLAHPLKLLGRGWCLSASQPAQSQSASVRSVRQYTSDGTHNIYLKAHENAHVSRCLHPVWNIPCVRTFSIRHSVWCIPGPVQVAPKPPSALSSTMAFKLKWRDIVCVLCVYLVSCCCHLNFCVCTIKTQLHDFGRR